MLRSGKSITEVAELTGHSAKVLVDHYAGAVGERRDQRLWTSWDDAWEWAVKETDIP
jgi:hypothetical protein